MKLSKSLVRNSLLVSIDILITCTFFKLISYGPSPQLIPPQLITCIISVALNIFLMGSFLAFLFTKINEWYESLPE